MPVQEKADVSGVFAQNIEWFGTDLTPSGGPGGQRARKFRVTIVASAAVNIQATLDGAAFFDISPGIANGLNVIDVPVRDTDLFNLRTDNVAGITLTACRIDEVFGDA